MSHLFHRLPNHISHFITHDHYTHQQRQVRDDCTTEVMQRSVAKKYLTMGRTSVISLVLADRTLDFEIEEVSVCFVFVSLMWSALCIEIVDRIVRYFGKVKCIIGLKSEYFFG